MDRSSFPQRRSGINPSHKLQTYRDGSTYNFSSPTDASQHLRSSQQVENSDASNPHSRRRQLCLISFPLPHELQPEVLSIQDSLSQLAPDRYLIGDGKNELSLPTLFQQLSRLRATTSGKVDLTVLILSQTFLRFYSRGVENKRIHYQQAMVFTQENARHAIGLDRLSQSLCSAWCDATSEGQFDLVFACCDYKVPNSVGGYTLRSGKFLRPEGQMVGSIHPAELALGLREATGRTLDDLHSDKSTPESLSSSLLRLHLNYSEAKTLPTGMMNTQPLSNPLGSNEQLDELRFQETLASRIGTGNLQLDLSGYYKYMPPSTLKEIVTCLATTDNVTKIGPEMLGKVALIASHLPIHHREAQFSA